MATFWLLKSINIEVQNMFIMIFLLCIFTYNSTQLLDLRIVTVKLITDGKVMKVQKHLLKQRLVKQMANTN